MFRIAFTCTGPASEEELLKNVDYSTRLGLPFVTQCSIHERPLAVVGGGPSLTDHLDELRSFPGDIWAVNQTASWLIRQGIENVWLITNDPNAIIAEWIDGVEKALLASSCHPVLFDKLKGKDIRIFHVLSCLEGEITGGPSTVSRTPLLALKLGYQSITFYGCEGSLYETTHATRTEDRPLQMLLRANGSLYRTTPDYYATTEYMSRIIPEFPLFLKERSGGLLRAMIEDPEWEILGYTKAMKDIVDPTASEIIYSI